MFNSRLCLDAKNRSIVNLARF